MTEMNDSKEIEIYEKQFESIREKFSRDRFATEAAGITIEEIRPQYARCEMLIQPVHLNARGAVMGGAIFTLADFAFAVAANQGRDVVTQASQITFLKAAQGKRLIAEARQVKDGKRVCFYEVKGNDDLGTEVAFVTINGYVVSP